MLVAHLQEVFGQNIENDSLVQIGKSSNKYGYMDEITPDSFGEEC